MSTSVLILDLGLSERFEASMDYARALVRSTQTGAERDVDVEYVRTTNRLAISSALLSNVSVLHVMGHGQGTLRPTIVSDWGDKYRVRDQAGFSEAIGAWPQAHCLIVDACNTWAAGWHRSVARCLPRGQELLYIGTTTSVTWAEATLFTGNFYAAAFRAGLCGNLDDDWVALQEACEAAAAAYLVITGDEAPFDWGWIRGSAPSSVGWWQ